MENKNEIKEKQLEKAFLSFYPKWQRPLIRCLAWICTRPPKTFWEIKMEELERNKKLVDRIYNMIEDNARLTNKNKYKQ